MFPSTERKCEICKKTMSKSYGSGRYCSDSCSRKVGGRARWNKTNAVVKPQDPYASADLGLVGEYVTVSDGKTKVTGWINTYDPETDIHTYVHHLTSLAI